MPVQFKGDGSLPNLKEEIYILGRTITKAGVKTLECYYWVPAAALSENEWEATMQTVNVYPNPSNGIINIDLEDVDYVELVNAQGEVVDRQTAGIDGRYKFNPKRSGMYYIRIFNKSRWMTTSTDTFKVLILYKGRLN